jgi:hypothetical protein
VSEWPVVKGHLFGMLTRPTGLKEV